MFVLLSSAASPRYRHDILRCISAPIGAKIQFRYAQRHFDENALESLRSSAQSNEISEDAVVCFADSAVADGSLPIIPVRRAVIEGVAFHGSSVSVQLRVEDFAFHEGDLSAAIAQMSGQVSPSKKDNKVVGKFAFAAGDIGKADGLNFGSDLAIWEKLVERLQKCGSFENEAFFWVVLGLRDAAAARVLDEKCDRWNDKLESSSNSTLCIYHFRPQRDGEPNGELAFNTVGPIEAGSPSRLSIDSRYDLKRWNIRSQKRDSQTHYGWLIIRCDDEWELELPVVLEGSIKREVISAFFAGVFIAAPSVISLVTHYGSQLSLQWRGTPHVEFCLLVALSVVSGWIASYLVLSGVPRVRP